MRKSIIISLLALGALTAAAKEIKEYVVTTTPQMSCQNCENRIKGNLRFEKGVKKIETDLQNQRVTVTYDADKTDETKLEEAFGKINYKVTKIEDCDDSQNCPDSKKTCTEPQSGCTEQKGSCCGNKNSCDSTTNVAIGYGKKK